MTNMTPEYLGARNNVHIRRGSPAFSQKLRVSIMVLFESNSNSHYKLSSKKGTGVTASKIIHPRVCLE